MIYFIQHWKFLTIYPFVILCFIFYKTNWWKQFITSNKKYSKTYKVNIEVIDKNIIETFVISGFGAITKKEKYHYCAQTVLTFWSWGNEIDVKLIEKEDKTVEVVFHSTFALKTVIFDLASLHKKVADLFYENLSKSLN